ncbi:hypothetical protein AS156_25735 [Bradyrhizobium macuxiense]|uniref:Prohead serine protease domain-containing protein n=1 Tax=Bradyrhizobium macuxiense TaxID=1755647 RepID=A0A109K5D9_9BRAD|nr:hypothetical protein AS156_19195 [Bradyrhizobium macuxiense]KWV59343.1 hypothetical protein AS156_31485 [Bradyrhizobium macuxiense]KWV59659.1 hypothetical protein AS156_30915 [Bradyrhizobium macuxiense]KWV61134.1 hypothetical protein AS156_25735 [Bradyrhizobium macuxiense]
MSKGSDVVRAYGVERLAITPKAVDISRVEKGVAPVLDTHRQESILGSSIGKLAAVWFEGSSLVGRLQFHKTDAGKAAFGMVQRGEANAISIGYSVQSWEITDEDGRVIDPAKERLRVGEADYVFTATRWSLYECSIVSCPADPDAQIRQWGGNRDIADPAEYNRLAKFRMETRQRMLRRERMYRK